MSKNKVNPYSISQNFLTDRRIIARLLSKTDISENDTVLEIGAGKGHITKALSKRAKTVISYEIDRELYNKLKPDAAENVRLICGDFLKCGLPRSPYKVFANIPFSKTTEIMRKLTADRLPEHIWLIMEKGAAKRFCGLPRENTSSLLLKPFFDVKISYYFNRTDFHPAPRVDVVLLELAKKPADIPIASKRDFAEFISRCTQYGFYGSRAPLTKKQVSTALRLAGLPDIKPSGDVTYVQWLCLFRCWVKFGRR